jgi:hypothetical protein
MRLAVLISAVGCLALGAISLLGARAAVIALMGFALLPALPIVLTAAERLAGTAAGTAGAIVWMAGNLGGLVVALIVQVLINDPLAAFFAMAAVSLLGLPLAARFPSIAATLPSEFASADRPTATAAGGEVA